MTSQDFD